MMKAEIKPEGVRLGISANVGGVDIGVSYSVMQLWLAGKVKLYGIPLTEERLIEFGFAVVKGLAWKGSMEIYQSANGGWSILGNIRVNTLDYVHQLQNLTFDLTGEELTPITK